MKIFKLKTINIFIIVAMAMTVFAMPVSASTTDGTIDSTYKYAWGENIGWINFGTENGNVHITDSGLSGSALSETVGWINLDNVINDNEGNLSGYGWSENTGWIKFNPTNGGVIINSSGEFTGSALSETVGWIIFGGDYVVKTDWRPQSARPCTSWTYSEWSNCASGQQTRTVASSSPSGCVGGSPILNQTCSSGGGLPPASYNPPSDPEAGFKISINQGAEYTDSLTVNLSFVAGADTARMTISESSDFINGVQAPYQQKIKWELLPISISQISKEEIVKTLYVKFYTQYGVASQVFSDSIIFQKSLPKTTPEPIAPPSSSDDPVITPVPLLPSNLPSDENYFDEEVDASPTPEPTSPPFFETPPEKPEPFNSDWNLIDVPEVKNFFPKTNEVSFYTQKFPSLSETFRNLNISQTSDIASLAQGVSFGIPSLREILSLNSSLGSQNQISPIDLSAELKAQIPSEVVFLSISNGKISLDSFLVLNEDFLKQKISISPSTNLNITLKPAQPARSINGYIALKKSAYSMNGEQEKTEKQEKVSMSDLIRSSFVHNALAQEEVELKQIEQRFVLAQFQYSDPDQDGIWTADIQTPAVKGEYEIISLISYQDPDIPDKEIRLITVIDPEGYVYRRETDGVESRLPGVSVSIYWLNSDTNQYELWNAENYDQKNPQTTDATGRYSFLVPAGSYYLEAEATDYRSYQSDIFEVSEAINVHMNLELIPKWSLMKDWKTILLILFGIALVYNFYRDRKRKE